jgi:hypothetical protein
VRFLLPNGLDFACGFEAVKGWIKRPFLEPKQTATGFFQTPQNLKPVRLASFQRGEDHWFEMTTKFVAVDRIHTFILDSLGIKINGLVALFLGGPARCGFGNRVVGATAFLDAAGQPLRCVGQVLHITVQKRLFGWAGSKSGSKIASFRRTCPTRRFYNLLKTKVFGRSQEFVG